MTPNERHLKYLIETTNTDETFLTSGQDDECITPNHALTAMQKLEDELKGEMIEKKHLKSSQEFCKDLEQYGFIDEVGYINEAMQHYAQQYIDFNKSTIATHTKRIAELEEMVERLNKQLNTNKSVEITYPERPNVDFDGNVDSKDDPFGYSQDF